MFSDRKGGRYPIHFISLVMPLILPLSVNIVYGITIRR